MTDYIFRHTKAPTLPAPTGGHILKGITDHYFGG
jgi:hypothetical protein